MEKSWVVVVVVVVVRCIRVHQDSRLGQLWCGTRFILIEGRGRSAGSMVVFVLVLRGCVVAWSHSEVFFNETRRGAEFSQLLWVRPLEPPPPERPP